MKGFMVSALLVASIECSARRTTGDLSREIFGSAVVDDGCGNISCGEVFSPAVRDPRRPGEQTDLSPTTKTTLTKRMHPIANV